MDILDRLRSNRCASGCNTFTACACSDLEDAAAEIERLRGLLQQQDTWLGQRPCQYNRCPEYLALAATISQNEHDATHP